MAGVWANYAEITQSEHEFTLDFVRIDHAAGPDYKGILVARVAVSSLFITQLIDALQKTWDQYAMKAFPQEVFGEPGQNEDQEDVQEA